MRRPRLSTWTVVAVALAAAVVAPMLAVASSVLAAAEPAWAPFARTALPRYLANTLWLALGVGLGVLLVGATTAWLVTTCQFPGRRIFEWALLLPMAVPAYILAYAYTDLLQFPGPVQTALRAWFGWRRGDYWFPDVRSLGGAILMLVLVLYPYVYLLARAAFLETSASAYEASRVLGRGAWRSFFQVALPMARPALAAGLALAMMEALADFGTVSYFAVETFTTGIYRAWFSLGAPVAAAQLATYLLGFILLILVLERFARGRARYHQAAAHYRQVARARLGPVRSCAAAAWCLLPIVLGFLLPAGVLVQMAAGRADRRLLATFPELARNSLTLAALAAVLAVLVALALAATVRFERGWLPAVAARVAALGYALPGSVIAVGVLAPAGAFDNSVDRFARSTFGVATGLLVSGTLTLLLYAYVVRFLAAALSAVESGFSRVTPSMDWAARTLGHGRWGTLRRVHAPLVRGSVLTAALLVFVDVVKELPATMIVRPFNFDTLAVRAYTLAADERLAQSSYAALAIVAVGILPVIVLSRAIARSRPGTRHA